MSEKSEKCSLERFTDILQEVRDQPAWRLRADRESDYCDGNQLDSEILQAQAAKGIPPSIENLLGKTIKDIRGIEAKNRTDWKVIPESDTADDDVAAVFNQKLNQAERESGADRACTEAHKSQVKVGIGWVEVAREKDPFKFPYRCKAVHRNEIWWDMKADEADLSDAMWIMRRRWTDQKIAQIKFPKKKAIIEGAGTGWHAIDLATLVSEGGADTNLAASLEIERGWTVEEQEWRNLERRRVCLFEVLTRHYKEALVLRLPDKRVVEFDPDDILHRQAVAVGFPLEKAMVSEIWRTFFLGPHKLHEERSEYKNGMFNYVPFFGEKEDRTGVPYGVARDLMYMQDEVNARISKMQWGLSATRTERTEGAVAMEDAVFRQTVGRPDADIILDAKEMAKPGAKFEVIRDFELNSQQYQRLLDLREAFKYIGGNTDAFSGQGGADSFIGLSAQIEQSMQSLATVMDGFKYGRNQVGSLLLSMLIEDSQEEEDIVVSGGLIKDDRTITINQHVFDEETGHEYKTNDVVRTKLKVTLSEVPSTPSFRQQQLSSLSEFGKASSPEIQAVLAPHIANLADVPNKEEIVKAIRMAVEAPSPEQIEKDKQEAIDKALAESGNALKERELDIKERHTDAQIEKMVNEAVAKSVDSVYASMQAAAVITQNSAAAPLADSILNSAGFIDKDTPPIVPELNQAIAPAPQVGYNPANMDVDINTNPTTPTPVPLPSNPGVGAREGIETQAIEPL